MGSFWQQGSLSPGAIGRFLAPEPPPQRLFYIEPLRRRMRVRFGGAWIADSEHVLLLFEPGRYPVAYFPKTDISPEVLEHTEHSTRHPDLGLTAWYTAKADQQHATRAAWQQVNPPSYAADLRERIAFAWQATDAFYEEDERILGHAADSYHSIDIRQASRKLVARHHHDRIVADTERPIVLNESGFARRWYVPRVDIDESALSFVEHQTFCPCEAYVPTMILVRRVWRHGRIVRLIPKSDAFPASCPSSRTSLRRDSTEWSCVLSRVRP